jgi:hypothetical protein
VFLVGYASLAAFVAVPSKPFGYYGIASVPPGLIDSARWAGQPSDNTLPYRTGQVALHKLGGAQIRDRYAVGWWISDRTPLTGLAFAFAAGALHVTVPANDPTLLRLGMSVRDAYGFWAYNLVAILLNYAIVLGTYLLALVWLGRRRVALVAALVCALMPGVVLNSVYTWPKQAVAYFMLVAAALALRRRPGLCGVFAALGFLCHPGGAFWLLALPFLLWAMRDDAARFRGVLGRYAGGAALTVLPWQLFVSLDLHATSKLALEPLGYVMLYPTDLGTELPIAWHNFVHNGIPFAVWTRLNTLTASIAPIDLTRAAAQPLNHDITVHWTDAHGFSWWGMVGVFLFPAAVVAAVRHWPELRKLTVWLGVPALVSVALGSGVVPPFMSQSMFTVLGLLAVPAAFALLEAGPRVRIALLVAIAFELLTVVWLGLYAPFSISTPARVLFSGSALLAQLALLGWLAVSTGVRSWPIGAGPLLRRDAVERASP